MNQKHLLDTLEVTDDDVDWVCNLLQLPISSFRDDDGQSTRLEILKSNKTLDIEACPGSGKTTLLVAKLAILARKWPSFRKGICVLSHTNVARKEIESRLGNTTEGQRLLSYPHFIGTTHGFVNEFLSIPWLRSKPFPIKAIDNEIAQIRRWNKLSQNVRTALDSNKHDYTKLLVQNVDFSIGDLSWGKNGKLGRTTKTYKAIQSACKTTSEEGFFCHDEMFLWGRELLEQIPTIRQVLRERFPLLFIDEVQDNSEIQSALLFTLFMEGENPVTRQRFGDSNQAIYQRQSETKATTDPFPDSRVRKDIPNSYRFGQSIADLANPLAPVPQNLVGHGPSHKIVQKNTENDNAIFLFNDKTIGNVIPNFAEYLLKLFSDDELRAGTFTAVGAVHRPGNDDHLPRFVGQYWPDYDHEITPAEPTPKSFLQYVSAGRKWTDSSGEIHHVVDKIAEAILRLVWLAAPSTQQTYRKRKHQQLLDLLSEHPGSLKSYLTVVSFFGVEGGIPTLNDWNDNWVVLIKQIASVLVGTQIEAESADDFLKWNISIEHQPNQLPVPLLRDNVFRYPTYNPRVKIRVGSIHSVKGQTHTATLVLDTYYHEHHLEKLKPWLLGSKLGGSTEGKRNVERLKQHYVAMTRPSHLLCLAMREDAFTGQELQRLKNMRWCVAHVTDSVPDWM